MLLLFQTDIKVKEFASNGITFKDKNYSKLYSKLSKEEQSQYKNFLSQYDKLAEKTDLEIHLDLEESICNFLYLYGFICVNSNSITGWDLTQKGKFACEFNEINPIIFTNNQEYIMRRSELILPTLSMFIDDGVKINPDQIIRWEEIEPEILYWENVMQSYQNYISKFPKWTYWPKNYVIIKDWLTNPNKTLDQIVSEYDIDLGLFVKILIKMYQISDELVSKLDKLNQTDLVEKIIQQKELLIRYPLKIDSLYINL